MLMTCSKMFQTKDGKLAMRLYLPMMKISQLWPLCILSKLIHDSSVRRPPLNRAEGGNCLSVLPLSNKKGNQRIWTILEIII